MMALGLESVFEPLAPGRVDEFCAQPRPIEYPAFDNVGWSETSPRLFLPELFLHAASISANMAWPFLEDSARRRVRFGSTIAAVRTVIVRARGDIGLRRTTATHACVTLELDESCTRCAAYSAQMRQNGRCVNRLMIQMRPMVMRPMIQIDDSNATNARAFFRVRHKTAILNKPVAVTLPSSRSSAALPCRQQVPQREMETAA
jgi:hypothetical protein